MSSELFLCEGYLYSQSRPADNMDLRFLSDSPLPFPENPIDSFLQEITTSSNQVEFQPQNTDQNLASAVLSSSPPTSQLQSLSLHQGNNNLVVPLSLGPNLANGLSELSSFDVLQVKAEDCQKGLEFCYNKNQTNFFPHSYNGAENVAKFMQRSYSSNSTTFDKCPGISFRLPSLDAVLEMGSPSFQTHTITSPEDSFFTGQMRKVCSTGDLQNFRQNHVTQKYYSSPSGAESFLMEDHNFKVGRYSAEERKEKILKYRTKRSQRNFNKTIKYACRKTLADNRPRIRGRFARNEEVCDIPKSACSSSTRDEEEDFFWLEGLHEEEEANGTVTRQSVNSYGAAAQFHYYGY